MLWNSRTKMEHAKTRAIPLDDKSKVNGHAEKKDDDLTYEDLEDKIVEKDLKISDITKDLQRLHAQIKERDDEIKRMRDLLEKNTMFMQQIIMELINKPTPKTAAQMYAESKLDSKISSVVGPKGKLP